MAYVMERDRGKRSEYEISLLSGRQEGKSSWRPDGRASIGHTLKTVTFRHIQFPGRRAGSFEGCQEVRQTYLSLTISTEGLFMFSYKCCVIIFTYS
jgi:hypothetical protein